MLSQIVQFLLIVVFIVVLDRILSPHLQNLGGLRWFLFAGFSTWIVHSYYSRYKRKDSKYAETDLDGVSYNGTQIPWNNIENIEFTGETAYLNTSEGRLKIRLLPYQVESLAVFNNFEIESNKRIVLSRLPDSQTIRIYLSEKVERSTSRLLSFAINLSFSGFFFFFCYILQDSLVFMCFFGFAGIYMVRDAVGDFRMLRIVAAAQPNPLCVLVDNNGMSYQHKDVSSRVAWSDIEGLRLVFDAKSCFDLGFTILYLAHERKVILPFISGKVKDVIVNAAGFRKKQEDSYSEYFGV